MKDIKIKVIIATILSFLMASSICYGLDTDLYVLSGTNIPPNVLIILDSSASMDEVSSGQSYDPLIDYSLYAPPIIYPSNAIYVKSGNNWIETGISCPDLWGNYLAPFGQAINYSNASCGINKKDFQTGNFRNFMQLNGGPGGSRPRFGLATGVIHSYVNTTSGVRFAVMAFNRDRDGNTVRNNSGTEYVSSDGRDNPTVTPWDAVGGRLLGFVDENGNGKTALFNELAILKNDSWSPLAETLYEAGVYFQGAESLITRTPYSSPISNNLYCQKNYVLIISDGVPTKDNSPILSSPPIGDQDGDGKAGELDDVAKYHYGLDLSNGRSASRQNIKTYTIGFSITHPLMEDTARNGGGKYFYVWSSQSFNIAFQAFIADVLKESTSYVAPVVPISQMEKTSAGNRLYLAMFKPTEKSFWKGNIKKYGIATTNTGLLDKDNSPTGNFPGLEDEDRNCNKIIDYEISVGDILDKNGNLVIDCENKIKDTAKSYWSSATDGEDVEKGGVGEVLFNRTSARKIYTNLVNPNIKDDSTNAFVTTNTGITPEKLGLSSGDTTGKNKIIDFIHGLDAYDWEGPTGVPDGITNVKRSWILGAFIHSRPVVIHYNSNLSIIYAGANDGMLHAFNDTSGVEEWAFIPESLLPHLKDLNGEAIQFFVDGAPKAYIERDNDGNLTKGYLIFGLRRGGNRYIALDITEYDNPKLLWEISPSTTGFGELGQTWSTPNIGKINDGSPSGKPVAFVGGGYDENQDNLPVSANDTKGRAVYVIDIFNGSLIWSYSYAKNSQMKYSIPSDIARVDTDGNSLIDRLYVGDVGGQIWRFDIGDSNPSNWDAKVKVVFDANKGVSDKRKIFYPPDVTLEKGNYEILFFGTGDREHPKETTKINRLYAVKDKNPSSALSESDLYDATGDLLQTGSSIELAKLNASEGWYIKLDQNTGEKCLSSSALFYGVVYYTTFQPTFGEQNDPCFLGEGIARIYALNYKTGNSVFNLDGEGTMESLTRSDRSSEIGVSIPSGVIITFIGGTTVAYGGVGGGVFRPPLPTTKLLFPINWRTVF